MPPQRLPLVNGDDGVWGDILRQYLTKEHYNDDTNNAANGGHKNVTIIAGTATAGTAPLKFTSGTLLTTPEAGAIEFNADKLYFTKTTGPTRQAVATYDVTGSTGDLYYRDSSSNFTRLPIGSSNNVLTVSSGVPAWSGTLTSTTLSAPVINGTPTGTGVSSASTASTLALRDANKNLFADNFIATYTTTATAAGTTTLTVASTQIQVFTGTSTQTVTLPTTSIVAGTQFRIINNSTGAVTVNASGGTNAAILAANTSALVTALQATPTTNAHWDTQYWGTSVANAKKLTASNSLTLAGTDGTTMTFPGASDTVTTNAAAQILTNKTLTTPVLNGIPTGTGVASGPTASTLVLRDGNGNVSANAFVHGFTTTATNAGITTLTITSDSIQEFTGTTTHTVRLPTTSIVAGARYTVINSSTGAVTVQSSGSNTISTLPSGTSATFTALVATPTTAANWESTYINTGDVSSNTSTSVDSELAIFNGTTGKSIKRATGTGVPMLTAGVLSTVTALPMSRIGIGDFENIAAGSDFETEFYPWNLGTGRVIATDFAHSGTNSYKFSAGAGNATYTGGTIEVKEGEKLYVECWVRRDASFNATDARIRLGAMPGNLNVANLSFHAAVFPEVDSWVKKSFTTNAYPAGNVSINPSIVMTGLTAGNLWIDDIVIRRVKGTELIPDLDAAKITTGTLPVGRGGTGTSTLNGVVIGNGTSAFTTVTAPSGAIVGTTDTQTLTNKTISGSSNTLSNIALSSLSTTGTASGSTYLRGDGQWTSITTGITRTFTTTSGNYTAAAATNADYIYIIAGAHAGTLPTANGNTCRYTFKNNHTADVTLTRAGTDTIEGQTSITLSPSSSVDLVSNGTNTWIII